MDEPRKVKVGIQVTDEDGERLPREWLWADVVQETRAGGVYCLLNTAFFGPFALGDLVEARRRRNGDLVVTGLHRRGGRTAWLLWFRLEEPAASIEQLTNDWAATGSWVEGAGGGAINVAVERSAEGRPTPREVDELVRTGQLQSATLLADPADAPDDPVFDHLVA